MVLDERNNRTRRWKGDSKEGFTEMDKHRQVKDTIRSWLPKKMIKDPLSEFLTLKKNSERCSGAAGYISSEEIFSFFNNQNSRLSNFLFQIARGSGATLSECPFFFKKAHITRKTSSRQDHFKASRRKNMEQA
jgi:hypothetical protein